MRALTCDACGGNSLTMTDDGQFSVCDFCGTKHTLERIRAKVQEIKGVVEITKGDAEKERLVKNAEIFLNLHEIRKATDAFRYLIDEYPADYRGWLGLAEIAQREIEENFAKIEDSADKVCFANLSFSRYVGSEKACEILSHLSWLYQYYQKLIVLNVGAANEISRYEKEFIASYHKRNLPFINWLSANVLFHYETVSQCSPIILKWAEEIVDTYINKFLSNEIDDLYWRIENPYDKTELYPAALGFLQKGYRNAQILNSLPFENQKNLLRSFGISKSENGKCVFWLNETIIFVYMDGYGPSFEQCKTDITLRETDVEEFIRSKLNNLNLKFNEAKELISQTTYQHELPLREIISKFTKGEIKGSTYYWETDFSYQITKIDLTVVEYITKYKKDHNERSFKSIEWLEKGTNFDDILVILRKHNKKCICCGGEFKGLFNKVCSTCGKPKNY